MFGTMTVAEILTEVSALAADFGPAMIVSVIIGAAGLLIRKFVRAGR